MVENHRDEDVCRPWYALADEDHIRQVTAQEHLIFESKCWLHSNKQGSNTLPLRPGLDFKQALSSLHRWQRQAGEEPQVPNCSCKHQQWEARSSSSTCGIGKVHGGLLIIPKVTMEMHQVLSERERLVDCSIWQDSSKKTFMNSNYFVSD